MSKRANTQSLTTGQDFYSSHKELVLWGIKSHLAGSITDQPRQMARSRKNGENTEPYVFYGCRKIGERVPPGQFRPGENRK